MIRVSILYPNKEGSKFDHEYYGNNHFQLVRDRLEPLGLLRLGYDKGLGGLAPDSPAPYVAVGYLEFNTIEELQSAMGAHGEELMADIPNYTDIEPVFQIAEVMQ